MHATRERSHLRRRGFALVTVLLVLMALLVLCAPFLMTARNASRAGTQLSDRAQARLALDAAVRHARASLGDSHPSIDLTPYWDDAEEVTRLPELEPAFFDAANDFGLMWRAEVTDLASKADLNSAPPQLIANLLGSSSRLVEPMKEGDTELSVSSTAGFPAQGFVWIERELVRYDEVEGSKLKKLSRGMMAASGGDGFVAEAGPTPPRPHAIGAPVIDQRAFAPVMWRVATPDASLRELDAPEQLRDTAQLALGIATRPPDDADAAAVESYTQAVEALVGPIAAHGTTYGSLRAGHVWQRPVRVYNPILAGQTGILRVDELRWFAPGTTVEISDGTNRELGIVHDLVDGGIRLMENAKHDYFAYRAEVRAQVRRAVNVNLAEPELLEALFSNLQLRQKNERITRDEARTLAAIVVESRPFDGMEDFLRRVVLPAAGLEKLPANARVAPSALAGGGAVIDTLDAEALLRNALNANDSYLLFSTLPFCFTSRDTYQLDLRAVVNAQSGVERVAMVREQVELVVPQRDLMQVWARQEDFDDAFRLDREAPFWATGPNSLQRWDNGATPPSNFVPHFGTLGGQPFLSTTPTTQGSSGGTQEAPVPQHVFASREDTGWAQLWTAREPDAIAGLANRFVTHFDHETSDPEGRSVASEPLQRSTAELNWTSAQNPLLRAFHSQMWLKPRALTPSTVFDVGRSSLETDRVQLYVDGTDLVLRVFDGAGDHPGTVGYIEAGEARFALAPDRGPGLQAGTWSHVALDVRGNRPSQISMLVDGRAFGVRYPGLTRLTSGLSQSSTQIAVESLEGFPDPCVVRIGDELIECRRGTGSSLNAAPVLTGVNAGFGGRLARVPFIGGELGIPSTTSVDMDHPAGAPVELYGYTSLLASNVPSGAARLPGNLGAWSVARATGVVGGQSSLGDPILLSGILAPLGYGIEGSSSVSGLKLAACDQGQTLQDVMSAFSQQGGYALLVQVTPGAVNYQPDGQPAQSSSQNVTVNNSPIFGFEIVRYSGWSGDTLNIASRAALPTGDPQQSAHAFVVNWDPNWQDQQAGVPIANILYWQTFVVPISIPAPGANSLTGFLQPVANAGSEFAQITELATAELTEWVRYDTITPDGHLVRNERTALIDLRATLTLNNDGRTVQGGIPAGGGGGGGGGGAPSFLLAEPASAAPAQVGPSAASLWQAWWGTNEDTNLPLTRAARSVFQFRGVCGTHSHDHAAGVEILPVWRVLRSGVEGGEPGRFDSVFLMDQSANSLGWPVRVHRTYRPSDRTVATWTFDAANPMMPTADQVGTAPEDAQILSRNAVMIALDTQAQAPVPVTVQSGTSTPNYESRTLARVIKHPSGERPREADRVVIGRDLRGGAAADMILDEVVFHTTGFGGGSNSPLQGGQLALNQDLSEAGLQFNVRPQTLRIAAFNWSLDTLWLEDLPRDAGLLQLGEEIVCYSSYDATSGTVNVTPGGRGLLGTRDQTHEIGATASYLEHMVVSILSANIGAGDATLPLVDTAGFPPSGTVLVGTELVHYTRIAGSGLDMPRRSSEPGAKNGQGDGMFRGRFGTVPTGHSAGTPVILFPYRYHDRWTEKADAPELGYFGLALDQPNAYWRTSFFAAEEPGSGQVKIEVLQRLSSRGQPAPPWDGEPGVTRGLTLLREGMPRGEGHPIRTQADLVEWRVHARYLNGAFDEQAGLAHGWKQSPRLRTFGAELTAPSLVLRRVDE